MTTVEGAPDFDVALGDLQDHLPYWWRTQDPTSQLYALLTGIAESIDAISALWEQPYLDQVITTASAEGLQRNFALAWGLENEQLPSVLSQLVAYIQARAAETGSLLSLLNTLTTLVDTTINVTGGPELTFPASGGLYFPDPVGLTNLMWPMSGAGLTLPAMFGSQPPGIIMYEFPVGAGPSALLGLIFPADGSGLIFPTYPQSLPSDNVIINDGTTPIGAGSGLIFASNEFVQIIPSYATYTLTVKVQSWLAFDRGAFARAVERFQPADWYPTVIHENTTYS